MTPSRPRPRPNLSWWMRVRRFIRLYNTPIQFRSSIIRLRHDNKHPYLAFLRLLIPFPSWSFSVTEYFWYQSRERWPLHRIPDPKDPDPVRYATLACLAEELAVAFNWRLSLGLRRDGKHVYREKDEDPYPPFVPERPPEWTRRVPPIDRQLMRDSLPPSVLDQEGRLLLEKGGSNEVFAKRNIVTNVGWLYTI